MTGKFDLNKTASQSVMENGVPSVVMNGPSATIQNKAW
jgi:hypothetical protein